MPYENNPKDFDLFPFCWSCSFCGKKFTPHGAFYNEQDILQSFPDSIHVDELDSIPILANNHEAQETIRYLFPGETAAIICSSQGQCTNRECKMPFELKAWIDIDLLEKDNEHLKLNVNGFEILDGDYLQISCSPGFYRGVDIAEALSRLFLRWFYLKGEISVFCPFIDQEHLEYFDKTGINILKTNSSLGNPRSNANPFKKIITRRHTGFGRDRTTMTESIKRYLKELNGDRSFIEGQPGSGLVFVMTGSLIEVENRPRVELQDHHKYANYFHAKLYGGLLAENAEIVVTSYNYAFPEILQLESFAFMRISRDDFEHQISKFIDDIHMTLHPVDVGEI